MEYGTRTNASEDPDEDETIEQQVSRMRREVEEAEAAFTINDVEIADENDEFAGGFLAPAAAAEPAYDDEFVGGFAAPAPSADDDLAAEPGGPRELELLVPTKRFPKDPAGGLRVSFDDLDLLKVLNAEPVPADVVSHFPDWLNGLDGKRVRLRGFMYPTYADPVTRFILARDNQICCFGRSPKPYDLVTVTLAEGEASAYIQNRPFDVAGTFRIDPVHDGESWLRLYRIDDAEVIE